ncbi:hypothetical protein [Entomobacter blattae]|uniref:Uncharacterized protein n=1 Tax=Entomobacter blattae TaxID=2762277 RepID=A0A7H1NRR7_9PROT|nr:hypothetical protein [Entomobacter blattae]QNT78477.1 hypothetical protein JGUZn3_12510 [Entomobacter blattae]
MKAEMDGFSFTRWKFPLASLSAPPLALHDQTRVSFFPVTFDMIDRIDIVRGEE